MQSRIFAKVQIDAKIKFCSSKISTKVLHGSNYDNDEKEEERQFEQKIFLSLSIKIVHILQQKLTNIKGIFDVRTLAKCVTAKEINDTHW